MDEWYSIGGFNDPMSSLSHLVGTVVFFVFAVLLLRAAWQDRSAFWFCLQFVVASLTLLSVSFVYHMQGLGTVARDVMLRLDVAAIFVLIASTFTVIHGILFVGWKRWGVILLQWTIAIVGLTLRAIFFHQIPKILGDGIFLLMGWVGAYSAWLMWKKFGWPGVSKIIWGGVFYTIGVAIHSINSWVLIPKVWGPHETFHLLVLVGLAVHWTFVWEIADGSFQRRNSRDREGLTTS